MGRALYLLAASVAVVGGCSRGDDGPVRAVVIGEAPRIVDPTRVPMSASDAVLLGAAAEGLVRIDADGRIEPGLAIRWNVSDDGLSYIFRLGPRLWPDGGRVTAGFVARRLRAAAAAGSRNPLAGVLTGIEEIVATTDEVLEIRLTAPRPNLLQHLARPELAIVRADVGAGPFRVARDEHGHLVLSRKLTVGEEEREQTVTLEAARPALAVAMFLERAADLVLGGTAGDLPVVRAADPPAAALRLDPAQGLFGLAIVDAKRALGSADVRRALSMAIDRDAITAAYGVTGLTARATLTPPGLSNLAVPATPAWLAAPLLQRRAEARRLIDAAGTPVAIRVAMPEGTGYRLLFAYLERDWAAIGVSAERVAMPRDADLRLLDAVAPSRGASWYLERFTCARAAVCDAAADAALASSRIAGNANERAAYFAEADRRLTDAPVFIPVAAPVRWSLATRRLTGYRPNPFAVHGLTDLLRRERP